MVGSPVVAAFIAWWAFWILLIVGWWHGELRPKAIVIFLVLWLAARAGLPYVPYEPVQAMFSSFVAILDIALVLMIFKGDVRVT